MTTTAPYGTWTSPISAADTVAGVVGFSEIAVDGDELFWLETRPSEGGRQVLVRRGTDGAISDVTPPPAHPRTLVHEYGGGTLVVGAGEVVFSEFADQRLYRIVGEESVAVTAEASRPRSVRYADGRILPGGRLVCVREAHPVDGEAVNELVMVDLATGATTPLASGRDFYSNPRPNSDGTELIWLEWDHPNMPWDGTELKHGRLDAAELLDQTTICGGTTESIYQPEWDPADSVVYVSDRSGWWNLYRYDGTTHQPLVQLDADFGEPAWVFGRSSFGFLSEGRILAGFWEDGIHRLGVIDNDGSFNRIDDELSDHGQLVTNGGSTTWFVARGATTPSAVVQLDVDTGERQIVRSNKQPVAGDHMSVPEIITFPTDDDELAHAVFYPPANPGFVGPEGERPPLIVQVHGGPTSHVFPRLSAGILFWTTRGFGVVDVNYRGSTAYGREFRNKLRNNWGVADVADCLNAARYLAQRGDADGNRLVITGGSAGGYTTLAALAFGDAFSAGASYFGVADIGLLAAHTHKFESRYIDGIVGTDPEVIKERSPLFSADQISVPVALFQGLEDKVVPPEQAEKIAAALDAGGIPYAHVTYEGEDHGFRKAENIIHSLESELSFYGQVFGFEPAGDITPIVLVR